MGKEEILLESRSRRDEGVDLKSHNVLKLIYTMLSATTYFILVIITLKTITFKLDLLEDIISLCIAIFSIVTIITLASCEIEVRRIIKDPFRNLKDFIGGLYLIDNIAVTDINREELLQKLKKNSIERKSTIVTMASSVINKISKWILLGIILVPHMFSINILFIIPIILISRIVKLVYNSKRKRNRNLICNEYFSIEH